jgi:hypothetical protein
LSAGYEVTLHTTESHQPVCDVSILGRPGVGVLAGTDADSEKARGVLRFASGLCATTNGAAVPHRPPHAEPSRQQPKPAPDKKRQGRPRAKTASTKKRSAKKDPAKKDPALSRLSPDAGLSHRSLVTETHLDDSVRRRSADARTVIVDLLCRLVSSTVPAPTTLRFPLGDASNQPGEDCYLDVAESYPPFVPAGPSYWEIGTGGRLERLGRRLPWFRRPGSAEHSAGQP